MSGTLISADNSWALFAILACVAAAAIYLEQHYRWAAKMTGCVLALLGSMLLTNLHTLFQGIFTIISNDYKLHVYLPSLYNNKY